MLREDGLHGLDVVRLRGAGVFVEALLFDGEHVLNLLRGIDPCNEARSDQTDALGEHAGGEHLTRGCLPVGLGAFRSLGDPLQFTVRVGADDPLLAVHAELGDVEDDLAALRWVGLAFEQPQLLKPIHGALPGRVVQLGAVGKERRGAHIIGPDVEDHSSSVGDELGLHGVGAHGGPTLDDVVPLHGGDRVEALALAEEHETEDGLGFGVFAHQSGD